MQYRLRTLLILMAVGPPALAVAWWLNMTVVLVVVLVYSLLAVIVMSVPV